jgi:hypothetical protein
VGTRARGWREAWGRGGPKCSSLAEAPRGGTRGPSPTAVAEPPGADHAPPAAPAALCCTPRDTQNRHLNVIYNGESDTDSPPLLRTRPHSRRTPPPHSAIAPPCRTPPSRSPAALRERLHDDAMLRKGRALGVGAPSSSCRRRRGVLGPARGRDTRTPTHPPTRTAVALYREKRGCGLG